jgi:serine palmitoyltransferase
MNGLTNYVFIKVVKLAQKFKYRVILDDSLALGVLGKTGRGSAEHHGIDVIMF